MTADRELADIMLEALHGRRQIAPLSDRDAAFDLEQAYRVTEAVRALREARGERVVGRKIGFTNTTIWAEYGVYAPIWGYVYDTTSHVLADGVEPFDASGPCWWAPASRSHRVLSTSCIRRWRASGSCSSATARSSTRAGRQTSSAEAP